MISKMKKESMYNYAYKALLFLVGFLNVRVTINYLGTETYGLWATMISILGWINLSDFGISNGMRNKLTELITLGEKKEASSLVSTGYNIIAIIAVTMFFISVVIFNIINIFRGVDVRIIIPFYISICGFCINFVLNISRSIAYSIHKSFLVMFTQVLTSILTLFGTILISIFSTKNLTLFSINSFIAIFLSNLVLSTIIFRKYKFLIPRIGKVNTKKFKDIINNGTKFFIIQLCMIVLFSTDNVIISNILGNEEVARYNVISKVYNSLNDLQSIMLISFWAAVSKAITLNDIKWIKSEKNKLLILVIPFTICIIFISVFLNPIIKIWLGNESFIFDTGTIIVFALYSVVVALSGIYANIANGIGKLNIQVVLSIIGAVSNIPLSVIFSKYMSMGIAGVKLATLLAVALNVIFIPIQLRKEFKNLQLEK
ncbi:oligosaccharide flippase family protein [Clostridium magnum]|uniref:Polysaccharide biosynthesis protein n=1 Tax=Clostridium magnum DSM 2767 TaxID=1121326 RepID=A0A162RD19_9CLOT|nr:oligosaccharide flippase family protein [Clostridium magnum]KZL89729.1 polysaccharide biosynthesis protein [Clostridium magnum DSM 2767]SHH65123.1 Membrane protein involved in the export of O-antigen and teichoic acid [Clostridium magnum DSM 2767]